MLLRLPMAGLDPALGSPGLLGPPPAMFLRKFEVEEMDSEIESLENCLPRTGYGREKRNLDFSELEEAFLIC